MYIQHFYTTLRFFIIIPVIPFLVSKQMFEKTNRFTLPSYNDSTIFPFGGNSYKLTVHIFDTEHDDPDTSNAIVKFERQGRLIFQDSLYCMYADIDRRDFNNDGIEDVLIFHYTGGRANPTYYLYLSDTKNHRLIRVKGFEELPNPELDKTRNIITSIALSGTNNYSFYRINSRNELINLGYGYEENPKDSLQYERAIKNIMKHKKL